MAIEATARSSDCQFCRVRLQKSADLMYLLQLMGACSCRSCSSLYAATPPIDCASQEKTKMAPMTSPREWEQSPWRGPPAAAHRGEFRWAYLPTF